MTDAAARTRARRRTPWLIALGVCAAVLLAGAALIEKRRALASALIEGQLRARGVEEVEHVVEHVGLAALRVRDLRIGSEGDLVVEQIDARYSPASLMAGRLDELSVRGVRLRGTVDEGRVSFGALDPLLPKGGDGGGSRATGRALPAASIAIEDVEIELETPQGDLAASFEAHLSDMGGGERASRFHVATGDGRLRLPDLGFELRGVAVAADVDPETGLASGSFRIAALVDTRKPPRLREIALDGKFEAAETDLGFDVTVADAGRQLVLNVAGSHDIASGSGEAQLSLMPVEFEADGLQPAALSPLLGKSIEVASGRVEARGAITWGRDEALRAGLDLAMRDLSLSSEQGSVERLNAVVHVDGPWPPSTPRDQLVSMARADFGLALSNGLIALQLRPDGALDIQSAEWTFAGGTIRTRGVTDLAAETQALTLDLHDIDLSELLALVDLEGLSGAGRLDGKIPVVRRGGALEIREGKLLGAEDGGWIRYRAHSGIAGIASQQQGFDVALAALENFQYDELVATVNGDTAGPVNISVRLFGKNPDRFGGQRVDFTLNLEAHLVDLLRKATAVYRIPEEIEARLREISEMSP